VRDLVARYPGRWELYNMEDDRTEMHDLALEEPERVLRMADAWEETANRVGVRPAMSPVWERPINVTLSDLIEREGEGC
jgi:hypothetical protein